MSAVSASLEGRWDPGTPIRTGRELRRPTSSALSMRDNALVGAREVTRTKVRGHDRD